MRTCPWALLLALSLAPAAFAAPDDEEKDNETAPEKDRSLEVCLRYIANGREETARRHLKALPTAETQRKGNELLESSKDPAMVVGAAVVLSWQEGHEKARTIVRKRLASRRAKLEAIRGERDALRMRAESGARVLEPKQLEELRASLRKIEADHDAVQELWVALVEALGALGEGKDLFQLDRWMRAGDGPTCEAVTRGYLRSSEREALDMMLRSAEFLREALEREREDVDQDDPKSKRRLAESQARFNAVRGVLRQAVRSSPRSVDVIKAMGRGIYGAELLEVLMRVFKRKGRAEVATLAETLSSDGNVERRALGVRLLAVSRAPDAVEGISEAFEDDEPQVKIAAAWALTRISRRKAREALRELVPLLRDEDPAVRKAVHKALTRIAGVRIPGNVPDWLRYLSSQDL